MAEMRTTNSQGRGLDVLHTQNALGKARTKLIGVRAGAVADDAVHT
jgi:hypothetical protein